MTSWRSEEGVVRGDAVDGDTITCLLLSRGESVESGLVEEGSTEEEANASSVLDKGGADGEASASSAF